VFGVGADEVGIAIIAADLTVIGPAHTASDGGVLVASVATRAVIVAARVGADVVEAESAVTLVVLLA